MKKVFLFVGLVFFLAPSLAYGVTENYSSGDKYVGEMKNGKRHGFGTYYWTNEGVSYKGKWKKIP